MDPINIYFDIDSDEWKEFIDDSIKEKITNAITKTFYRAEKPDEFETTHFDLNILFLTNHNIKEINKDHRGKDKPTNVLSFPQFDMQKFKPSMLKLFPPDTEIPLGDILLAFETIESEAKEQKKTIENHLIHLIVHGFLHLLGYDHVDDNDAENMEKLESNILISLGYPDPYNIN